MIPISATDVKKTTDPASGTVLHFRYLTDAYLDRFMKLQSTGSGTLTKYRAAAEKTINAQNHGKNRKELMPLVVAEMTRLAREAGEMDSRDGFADTREMIDIFLCGWDGGKQDGKEWPPFPADGKPSRMFKLGDLLALAEMISGMVEELSGLSVSEVKN
jgi:hypothetical protein